jgi:Flp pilus assembly protein TadD
MAVADVRARQGDAPTAERLYADAAARLPNDPRPLLAWSALEARTGSEQQAITLLQQALDRGADELLVRNNLGGLLLRDGRWNEAKEQYQRLAELRPADAQIRYTLGVAQARTGDPVAAQESLVQALRLDPDHTRAKQALDLLVMNQRTNTGS